MAKMMSQKRVWPFTTRFDSRFLLRCLIAFNVILAVYNILTLQAKNQFKGNPCVVVINTSKGSENNALQNSALQRNDVMPSTMSSLKNNLTDEHSDLSEVDSSGDPFVDEKQLSNFVTKVDQPQTTPPVVEATIRRKTWTTQNRGSYSVIYNYIAADNTPSFNQSVTLTTQGTYEFLYHVEFLCQRWDGPISVAVYAPGDDIAIAINIIYYLRQCKHKCVKGDVSWHLVYDSTLGPKISNIENISLPETYLTNIEVDCTRNIDDIVKSFNPSFRFDHKLPYPINVVRNVARLASKTRYLLASDIELYPSTNIVSMFMKLLERERLGLQPLVNKEVPHTYVLPIFEVKSGIEPPFNKSQLVKLVKSGDAIFFHKWVCDACQNFPDRDKWIEVDAKNHTLNIFRVTKRQRSRNAWEPLYIGTNDEPLYDERLTWDGKRDKMSQMYEMCLRNYDLGILDNAFLVHAPGIKHIDPKDQKRRLPFIKRNNMVYNTIIAKLRKKYGTKNNC